MIRYTHLVCNVSLYCGRCNTHAQLLVLYSLLVTASTVHSTISKRTQKYNYFDFLALSENVRPLELKLVIIARATVISFFRF